MTTTSLTDIANLKITQYNLRNYDQVNQMIRRVRDGHIFDTESLEQYSKENDKKSGPLIQINEFEDGQKFILDGHHRTIGILLGGRDYIDASECNLLHYTYKDFADIVFLNDKKRWLGWVTPFDPRTHLRLSEYRLFKNWTRYLYYNQSPQHAIHYILTNRNLYSIAKSDIEHPSETLLDNAERWSALHAVQA